MFLLYIQKKGYWCLLSVIFQATENLISQPCQEPFLTKWLVSLCRKHMVTVRINAVKLKLSINIQCVQRIVLVLSWSDTWTLYFVRMAGIGVVVTLLKQLTS